MSLSEKDKKVENNSNNKPNSINIESAINLLSSSIKKSEDQYNEIHREFEKYIDKDNDEDVSLLENKSNSGTRNAIEYAKILTTIRSNSITAAKALVDSIEKREMLAIKKEEVELRREQMNYEQKTKTETQDILRKALYESHEKEKTAVNELSKTLANEDEDLSLATEKLLENELNKNELNKNELNIIENKNKTKNSVSINLNGTEEKNTLTSDIDDDDITKLLEGGKK